MCVAENKITRFQLAPRQHASLLLPMIQALLIDANITLQEIDVIAFGCGPGSFMGVRLATAMAQGLAFGLQIPVIPVSTLQIIAQTAYEKTGEKNILAGWDARMDEIYYGFYSVNDQGVMQSLEYDALSAPALIDPAIFAHDAFVLAGNAWSVYQNALPAVFSTYLNVKDIYPQASALLTIAEARFRLQQVMAPECALPHYVRQKVVFG